VIKKDFYLVASKGLSLTDRLARKDFRFENYFAGFGHLDFLFPFMKLVETL
jgi:hypothetical protein